jgi:hypothetical protein
MRTKEEPFSEWSLKMEGLEREGDEVWRLGSFRGG